MSQNDFPDWPGFDKNHPVHVVLAEFLYHDIQFNPSAAEELLKAIEDISSDKIHYWERTGNAFALELKKSGASLESLYEDDEEITEIPLSLMQLATSFWYDEIKRNSNSHR